MSYIKFVTDSASDIPAPLREELNIPDSEHRIFYDPQSEEEHCCDDDCGHHHH